MDKLLCTVAVRQVDDYLERDDLDASLDDLRTHKLSFAKQPGGRVDIPDNVDDYVVVSSCMKVLPTSL